ncbi:Beta-xylosidase [Luteitalea pratensis]|uniref:Beta-xylosidase n=1 Tax=Luteitalea pratensis TaxID=1855912 RepID=A0A143PLY1_LUTPR|nr:Beta-xylosidase [Luteitalea pratensis]
MHELTATTMAVSLCALLATPCGAQSPGGPPAADHWTISVYTGSSPFALTPPASVPHPVLTAAHVTDMPDLKIDTVAHPNLVSANGRIYMFFTAKDLSVNKGGIGLAESVDGLHWTFRKTVLREPFVLSSPFVFRWQGAYYMVPESYTEHTIRLYRATSFPDQWEYVRDLLAGEPAEAFISPTIVQHEQRWYLFTSPSGNDTLRLFVAANPTGPWAEHPASPVVGKDPPQRQACGDDPSCRTARSTEWRRTASRRTACRCSPRRSHRSARRSTPTRRWRRR